LHREADDVGARIVVDQSVVFQSRGVDLDEAAHVPVMQLEPPTNTTPGAMATAYLPSLSCTVGARDALIAACILPFNHTHSVLPTPRTIESCNQNLSMALVNKTLPFRTRRLGEYQQSRHRGGAGKRKRQKPPTFAALSRSAGKVVPSRPIDSHAPNWQ